MILRIQCPACGTGYRLQDPLPAEGKKYRCRCGTVITVAYPEDVRRTLAERAVEQQTTPIQVPSPSARTAPAPFQGIDIDDEATIPLGTRSPAAQRPLGLTPPPVIPPMERSIPRRRNVFEHDDTQDLQNTIIDTPSLAETPRVAPAALTAPSPPPPMPPGPPPRVPSGAFSEASTAVEMPAAPTPDPPAAETRAEAARILPPTAEDPVPEPEAPAAALRPRRKRKRRKKSQPRGLWGRRWVRVLMYMTLLSVIAGAGSVIGVVLHFSKDLPSIDALAEYSPPVSTVITDMDGRFVGEFFEQQRYVVPFEAIPKDLRDAFVAAEDAAFWEHSGVDYMGIARAMVRNIKAGRMAQGASTITQQVARSFLLTNEKKLSRKIKEALLAYRVENNFEKEYILYLYLNQIFLGHGAYGVQAAAKLYFDKDVSELTLPECAIIAGLPQAPSNYSPNRNFSAAKARQRYVLDQMADKGYITEEVADAAYDAELQFSKKRDRNLDIAPFYVEHVRRYLGKKYGLKRVNAGGLRIKIPIDIELQRVAEAAVKSGVRFADKRIGYRGPIKNLETDGERRAEKIAIDRERTVELRTYHPAFELEPGAVPADVLVPLQEGELTRGVVVKVEPKWALIDVGSHRGLLPIDEFTWCHNPNPKVTFRYFKCRRMDDMVFEGDLVAVRVVKETESWKKTLPRKWQGPTDYPRLAMEQDPGPEAALLSMRVSDGAILAMVGGSTFEGSEFNRAIQAKRQVGSTFKPFVYAAALDNKKHSFTPSTILVDAPIVEELSGKAGELWKPGNSGGKYIGDVPMRRGLVLSMNIVTLKILQRIGVRYTLEYMKRFGFDTGLEENMAMALGASSLSLKEMVRAYTVFPTLGDRREPVFITEVRDRDGTLLEATPEGLLTEDVMDPETAFIMVNLMHDVVRSGTATKAQAVGVPVAGKTGTTNAFRDAWFMGYTPELITGVWLGLDEFKTMGRGQYGGDVALPIWVEYMKAAVEKYPPSEYEKPKGIRFWRIDSLTGKLAREGEPAVRVPYKRGTEPTEFAPRAGQIDAADFLSGGF
jgi:penicillin-binding protein 1A